MISLKDFFVERLSEHLIPEGYKYVKSQFLFKKIDIHGIERIVRFDSWNSFTQIESSYEILIPQIEKLKKQIWGKHYDKFVTVGHRKDVIMEYFFSDKSDVNITVYSKKDIDIYIKKEVEFINSRGKAFFEFFENIESIYSYITDADYSEWIAYNKIEFCYLSVIVTGLIHPSSLRDVLNTITPIFNKNKVSEIQQIKFDLLLKNFNQNSSHG